MILAAAVGVGLVQWLRTDEGKGEKLLEPTDVVVGADGDVFVADPGSHRVYRLGDGGGLQVAAGSGADGVFDDDAPTGARPAGDATVVDLGEPVALAWRDGVLFVADRELGAVLRLSGRGTQRLETLPGPWASPHLVAATRSEGVYAGVAATPDGPLTGVVESAGTGEGSPEEVSLPGDPADVVGLGQSPDGQLVVWIDGNGLYVGDQRIVDALGDEVRRPRDLAVGAGGDIAIVEPGAEAVTVFRPDGRVRRQVELPWMPTAVSLGPDGELVVLRESDPDGTFVYRIEADDTVTPIGPG